MIQQFEKISEEEKSLLLKAPALVSILASSSQNDLNKAQKADAIKLSHLKTFTAHPKLLPYYIEVEKNFKKELEKMIIDYSPFDDSKIALIKQELEKVNMVMQKLDTNYAALLHKSLERYANHVKKSAHSIFQDFIFPIFIPGLTE